MRGFLTAGQREAYGRKAGAGLMGDFVNGFVSHFFATRESAPYQTEDDAPFEWTRGFQLGGRSLTWARCVPRWGREDFAFAGGQSGAWPISYDDIAPYYDEVEDFIGVSGARDGVASMPDGRFDPPMPMSRVEEAVKARIERAFPERRVMIGRTANLTRARDGRGVCQHRDQCARGCSYGAYFSSLSSTLPAAQATGRLSIRTDTIVERVLMSPDGARAEGVAVLDTATGTRTEIKAKLIVLCASALNSVQILLNSRSETYPNGLGAPAALGKFIMDHPKTTAAMALLPGHANSATRGRRPTSLLVPRYRALEPGDGRAIGSFFHQLIVFRLGWSRGAFQPGAGQDFAQALSRPGEWIMALPTFHECLPYADNKVELDPNNRDRHGQAQLKISVRYRDNERRLMAESKAEAIAMVRAAEGVLLSSSDESGPPGSAVHEMGGARMGGDPTQSVVNRWNQLHGAPNVLVTDGACMVSSASQNPSLTYMALTLRACREAARRMREGSL
ncbi:MAG: GMC family oxidoreductase [Alphaproteobacteria bacterium]|nr:GMC family oxidoreductase [Alphaproteobacteria bacterium]